MLFELITINRRKIPDNHGLSPTNYLSRLNFDRDDKGFFDVTRETLLARTLLPTTRYLAYDNCVKRVYEFVA